MSLRNGFEIVSIGSGDKSNVILSTNENGVCAPARKIRPCQFGEESKTVWLIDQ
jgi:hypothetical protein